MAHIAVFTIPAHGHVTPTLAVVEDLVGRGHQVTYVTVEEHAATIKAAGAEPLLYPTTWSRDTESVQGDRPAPDPAEVVQWAPLVALAETLAQVPAAKERFDANPPDLVLYDAVNYVVGRGLAHSWGVPAVRIFCTFASTESFSLFRRLTASVETDPQHFAVREFDRLTREFLDQHGFPGVPAQELADRDEELTLVLLPKAFQLAPELFDDRYVFVGPAIGDRDIQGSWQPPRDGLPVVLVSLGTEEPRPNAAFFRSCVEAFRDQPWHLVLSTDAVDPDELGPLPANCEAHRRVPQLDVLRHASAFVSHAGMGSLMEALSLKVPVVVIPKVPEQAVVGARATELGMGVFVSGAGVSNELRQVAEHIEEFGIGVFQPFQGEVGEWLPEAVRHLTSDPGVIARIAAMRGEIDAAGGARAAVDAIEARLAGASRSTGV